MPEALHRCDVAAIKRTLGRYTTPEVRSIQPIQPISGSIPFRRVGRILPARAIGAPWQDGNGARSDDDREELGGAARWIAPEVVARAQSLYRVSQSARQGTAVRKSKAATPRAHQPESVLPQLSSQPGASAFRGGDGWEAALAYGDISDALIRIQMS